MHIFRRNPHGLGKSLQVVAVIVKPARFTGFIDGVPLTEQRLGDRNALCGNIFVDGRPGSGFENAAQVGAAQKEMGREFFQCQIFTDVGIDIRKDLIYLGMIAGGFGSSSAEERHRLSNALLRNTISSRNVARSRTSSPNPELERSL